MTNVTSLLKTVKAVEDEASRGTQALESSIEVIGQELKVCLICFQFLLLALLFKHFIAW